MSFERPDILWLLLLAPLFALLHFLYMRWRQKALSTLGDTVLVTQLMERPSSKRKWIRATLWITSYCFLLIALANPRVGLRKEKVSNESAEVIICFDVSNSMLAEDVKPNRLTQAKFTAAQLIEDLASNKTGLIVFAGNSYVQMPLTRDARAAMMYLDGINTGSVPTQGTAIGNAIETALRAFEEGGDEKAEKGRAIIIITDGESHDANALEMAQQAAAQNIKIIILGVGTPEGGPIPIRRGNMVDGFKKDRSGNVVLTRLNEPLMEDLASESNGAYFNVASGKKAIDDVYDIIDGLDKTKDGTYTYAVYANHFQLFIGLALLLLLIEFLIIDRKPHWVEKVNIFDTDEK